MLFGFLIKYFWVNTPSSLTAHWCKGRSSSYSYTYLRKLFCHFQTQAGELSLPLARVTSSSCSKACSPRSSLGPLGLDYFPHLCLPLPNTPVLTKSSSVSLHSDYKSTFLFKTLEEYNSFFQLFSNPALNGVSFMGNWGFICILFSTSGSDSIYLRTYFIFPIP